MFKIYYYELRRLLVNKFFLCLLLITAFYSYQTMSGEIILGIADTAPFRAGAMAFIWRRSCRCCLSVCCFLSAFCI